jgi:hypothetical protein
MTLWPLGMNIYGLTQRCINYLLLMDPAQLARKSQEPSDGELSVSDALEVALAFRGVDW